MEISKSTKIKINGVPVGYTDRIYSGSYSEWRRPRQSMHDGQEFILKAPEKGLKSELIDGEWFWVCGCSKCLGTEESFCYWVCDKHNVCVTCGKRRDQITESPWGVAGGWRCKDCQSGIDKAALIDALSSFADNDLSEDDFECMDEVRCPHCNLLIEEIYESTQIDCDRCGGKLDVEIEYFPSVTTKILGDRVTLGSIK